MYVAPVPEAFDAVEEPPLLLLDEPDVPLAELEGDVLLLLDDEPGVADEPELEPPAVALDAPLIAFVSMKRSAPDAELPLVEPEVELPLVPTAELPPCRHPVTVTVPVALLLPV
jgi:hypothetical protein